MKLSKIVDAVNAKSFGETNWTYDDIYPYFSQAIAEINGELETFRHIPEAPAVSESDSFYSLAGYTALSDTHILNYIVTYIVVAMDNAQLAVTSRTQTYASQLSKYKQQLISDLYKWMPVNSNSNVYFDLEYGHNTNRIPNVGRVWYNEEEGGILSYNTSVSGTHNVLPTVGIHADNPYGFLVPVNRNQIILEGEHLYDYYFIPYESFRPYYDATIVKINIKGWNIPYNPIPTNVHNVIDIGYTTTDNVLISNRDTLFKTIWHIMKSTEGTAIKSVANSYVGSYVLSENNNKYTLKTYIFTHNGANLNALCGSDQLVFNVDTTNDTVNITESMAITIANLQTDKADITYVNGIRDALQNTINAIDVDGYSIWLSMDADYKLTAILKDKDGNIVSTSNVIDLPLESIVVSGAYDDTTKKVVLTLENGNTIEFSVADLVSGLQAEITSNTEFSFITEKYINNAYNNSFEQANVTVDGDDITFTDDIIEVDGDNITINADSTYGTSEAIYL